jgi:hypothetical protein
LSIVKGQQGYEFTIRTPGTPARWVLFDEEFQQLWKELEIAGAEMQEVGDNAVSAREKMVDLALLFFFYWVNFAPLTRGSAATGYCALFAILIASGYEVVPPGMAIKGMQMDWEAILCPSPDEFVAKIKPWFTKNLKVVGSKSIANTLPDISTHIDCARKMIMTLNLK